MSTNNGRGFVVPSHLGEFTQAGHFGLMGGAEQVRWAGGQLALSSKPGQGALVPVQLPLDTGLTQFVR